MFYFPPQKNLIFPSLKKVSSFCHFYTFCLGFARHLGPHLYDIIFILIMQYFYNIILDIFYFIILFFINYHLNVKIIIIYIFFMYLFFIINIIINISLICACICRLQDAQLEKHNVSLIRLKLTG